MHPYLVPMVCQYFQHANTTDQIQSFFRIEKLNTSVQPARADLILPDCTPGLMLVLDGGFSRIDEYQKTTFTSQDIFLFGQKTKAVKYEFSNLASTAIGIKLRPDSIHRLFGISAHEITDRVINLKDILDQSYDFLDRLIHITRPLDLIGELVSHLGRQQRGKETPPLLHSILQYLHFHKIDGSIGDLAAKNKVGYKKIDRLFRKHIGLAPKLYARILRLNHCMLARQKIKKHKLTDIAYQANFFDQTHFTKEIKQLTGMLPSEVFHRSNTDNEQEQLNFIQRRGY